MINSIRSLSWFLLAVALAASTHSAEAHILHGENVGFGSGFEHPISGWDHILAMVAVGIWGAELGAPAIWMLPVTFPLIMAMGGFLGLVGIPLPGVEIGIAASAIVLGIMVFGALRPPLYAAVTIVGIFGLFHGYAHGSELPPGENALLYSLGFVIATGMLHCCGISIGLIHKWPAGRMILRGMGALIAAGGIYFLWQALQPAAAAESPARGVIVAPPFATGNNATA